ncbi:MAG: peptidoglycan DD-metalloendopeptidase family protein [Paludibacteraceae bacterium]|nr:peptidoglycan DD-metalloendopeptidase family protein [Paludibacteraceae bacterium]
MNKLYFLIPLLVILFSCNSTNKEKGETTQEVSNETTVKEPKILYGINADSMDVIQDEIPNNKTLSDILTTYGVSQVLINTLAEKSKSIFDVRRMKRGNKYCILRDINDTLPQVKYFIYEIDQINYITYKLSNDNIEIIEGQKECKTKERIVEGEITTSLWNAITEKNVPFMLAYELSNIYAWNIDFFGLQKGDRFKVDYTEVWVDSTFIKIDNIKCAIFNHCGTDFHAIPFQQNGRIDYFDYEGNSLRKAFLKAPLQYSRISSTFSNSRLHPVLKIRRPHHGIDYAAPVGTPVMSIGDGHIIEKRYHTGGGNTVKVRHNGMYTTVYMHLSKFAKGISVGSLVKQGQTIGYVGSTGLSTGPHLDFRVYKDKSPINPIKMESPSVEPVKKDDLSAFNAVRDSLIERLNSVRL